MTRLLILLVLTAAFPLVAQEKANTASPAEPSLKEPSATLSTAPLPTPSVLPTPESSPSGVVSAPTPVSTPAFVATSTPTPAPLSSPKPALQTSNTPLSQSNTRAPADVSSTPEASSEKTSAALAKEAAIKTAIAHVSATKKSISPNPYQRKNAILSDNDPSRNMAPSNSLSNEIITSSPTSASSPKLPDDKIKIQFPHTSIQEVLSLYEKLTGKRIIRDSNLSGPDLSIMIADPVSKKDAISIIESSMLLNGYTLLPSDDKTVKVLGPNRPPRTEGVPLFQEESALPVDGDKLVSFYQPLHFLTPNEAINILQGVVQLNPFGSLVAVPNTSALVITDKTPIVRKALAILQVIDHEPSQIITEFIPLQRADAEKTVDTLNQIFGKESSSSTGSSSSKATSSGSSGAPGAPGKSQAISNQPAAVDTSSSEEERVVSGKVQFIADKRTNRILLVTRAENYRYVRELIDKLDQAQQLEEPLVRQLNYVSATDVFPVLVQMLKNKDDDTSTNSTTASPQSSPQSAFKNSSGASSSSSGGSLAGSSSGTDSSSMGGSTSGGTSGSSGGGNTADRLNDTSTSPPQSAIIGSTSLVADPTANSIIVYGPPESKAKARQLIDLLDRRPQQVYLAAVIGQMELDSSTDYGAAYLFHYKGFNTLLSGDGSQFGNGNPIATIPTTAAGALAQGAGGLTVFGAIGGSLDTYANFLESTHKFRTIARPIVYTSNNRKATIFSGQQVPYQSSTLSSVVAGSTANNTANSLTANITYQNVLLKLEVIPLINSDKEINLIIAQQNQSVDTAATVANAKQQINAPTINTQELTTSVRVPSGSTIVLGGLITDEKTNDKNGIPYINNIPLIGPLLGGYTSNKKVRKELVIMIQPVVIDSNQAMEKASEVQGGESDLGKKSRELKAKLTPSPTPAPKKKWFQLFGQPKVDNF